MMCSIKWKIVDFHISPLWTTSASWSRGKALAFPLGGPEGSKAPDRSTTKNPQMEDSKNSKAPGFLGWFLITVFFFSGWNKKPLNYSSQNCSFPGLDQQIAPNRQIILRYSLVNADPWWRHDFSLRRWMYIVTYVFFPAKQTYASSPPRILFLTNFPPSLGN